jgi:hypothetical protein
MAATCECKCKNCGDMFTARVADRKRGWAKFCSKSCKAKRQEKQTHQFRNLSNSRVGLMFPGMDEGSVQGF